MAVRINTLSPPRRKGRPCKYPWAEWMDGSAWFAQFGVDYECSLAGFRSMLAAKARTAGMSVETHKQDGGLEFRFSEVPQ